MYPQSPTRYMKKFAARHGVADLHPDKLRHTFATAALQNGVDVKQYRQCYATTTLDSR
ncbi:tyrosine-type recombinase/integrase [Acutalibacter muris]|uniref:tyrosine-type recombinase/integrase n=1 Tax=Acutalibacter muris TaxID=1796620 RepID=UPI0039B862D9